MSTVFLSYARGDDEPFVKRLYDDLTARGFDVWFDRVSMPSRQLTFLQEIRDAIDARDRLVLVVGPKAVESDYVTAEWRYAIDACKGVNPVLRLGDYDLLPDELKLLDAPDFRNDDFYDSALDQLVRQISEPLPPLGQMIGVPELPPHFMLHPDRLKALKDAVLADLFRPVVITGVAAKTGIYGMGGIGKSVLAAALARDAEVRRAFPDGVIWIPIGESSDILRLQASVAEAMGQPQNFENLDQGKRRLKKLFEGRAAMFVLDNVWRKEDAEAFDVLGTRCRAVMTTRDSGLITALGGTQYQVQLLTMQESVHLLAEWAEMPDDALPAVAAEVADECGRLPLALAICGAMVRDGTPWSDVLDALKEADLRFVDHPHGSVLKSIKVGVDALPEDERERFVELCALPPGERSSEAAVVTLWEHTGGLAGRYARDLLTRLARRSLVQLDLAPPSSDAESTRLVSLHDLLYDYACMVSGDRLEMVERLVDAYAATCPDGWASGPNDGYFFQHLCRHLTELERWDELVSVLTDLDVVDARSRAGMVYDLVADYNRSERVLPEGREEGRKEEDRQRRIQDYVDRLIAHSSDPDSIPLPDPPRTVDFKARPAEERRGDWTPLERVNAWRHLVANHTQWLGKDIPPIYQLAYNSADSGPVAEDMERSVVPDGVWLKRNNRLPFSQHPMCQRVLEGHTNKVNAVSITSDGRRAVSGSDDKTLRVWDLETGESRLLEGHADSVSAVAITPDGRRAISGSADKTLRVWNLENGDCLCTLKDHTEKVTDVGVTPDGTLAISGSHDNTLRVWNLNDGVCLRILKGQYHELESVSFTPDAKLAVSSGTISRYIRVWNLENGDCVESIPVPDRAGFILCRNNVRVTPDGRVAVLRARRDDTIASVWDITRRKCLRELEGHVGCVSSVSISPDARWVVSGSFDNTVRVWDVHSGQTSRRVEGHRAQVNSVSLSDDGRKAVSGSDDGTVRIWDARSGNCLFELEGHESRVNSVSVSGNGRMAVSGSDDTDVRIWDVVAGKCLSVLTGHTSHVHAVNITPDGRWAISGCGGQSGLEDSNLLVWDVERGERAGLLAGHNACDEIQSVCLTPDGLHAVSGADHRWNHAIRVWNVQEERCLHVLEDGCGVWSLMMTPDGQFAVSYGPDHTVRIWNIVAGECIDRYALDVNVMCVTADLRLAATMDEQGVVRIWDMRARRWLAIHPRAGRFCSLAISNDGRTVCVGTRTGEVSFFNVCGIEITPGTN